MGVLQAEFENRVLSLDVGERIHAIQHLFVLTLIELFDSKSYRNTPISRHRWEDLSVCKIFIVLHIISRRQRNVLARCERLARGRDDFLFLEVRLVLRVRISLLQCFDNPVGRK